MKSVNKSKLGKSVSSNLGSKTSAGEAITEVIVNGSEKSDESIAHVDQSLHESKSKKLRGGANQSPQVYGEMIVALNKTMLSYMEKMDKHMTQQTELWNDMKKSYNVMQVDIKEIKHDLHDSDGLVAKMLAPIQFDLRDPDGHLAKKFAQITFDLRDPDGHLAKMLKESEERSSKERKESEERIIQAIETSKEDSRLYTDKKVSENSVSLLKTAGVAVFTLCVAAVGYAEWLGSRISGK